MGVEDSNTAPRFVLRGSTTPLSADLVVFGLLAFVALLFGGLVKLMLAWAGWSVLVFGGLVALSVIGAIVHALFTGRSLLLVYPNRVVLDTRPEGGGARVILDYAQLRSVSRAGSWIRLRCWNYEMHSFRGARLHVEDAFDTLAECLEERNPECIVLRRL